MKIIEKNKAVTLRQKGFTLNEIIEKTGYSKASVSLWVKDVVLTEKQKNRISKKGRSLESIELRRHSRLKNEKSKKDAITNEAKKVISSISQKDLLLIGAMLYLGEGGKSGKGRATIANSDPDVISIMMRFFREICQVPETKFRGLIHIHSHLHAQKAKVYWSTVSGIPQNQFYKTYSKKSIASLNKRNTLPYGTLDIYVCDTKLFLTIMGWIEKIKELVLEKE